MKVREYGQAGLPVFVLHGGPGVPGYMSPVARELAGSFRAFEPLQRGSGGEPLTVARHVADLREAVLSRSEGAKPALVGHSWGAMLALAFAAAHPGLVSALVLIGCGTFDLRAREQMLSTIDARISVSLRRRIDRLRTAISDPDERLRQIGDLTMPVYAYELVTSLPEIESCDARAHQETWEDMVRLQEQGVYPAAFEAIDVPVIMLHGADDPHPGTMIRAGLATHLPQLEFREWEHCGHYPWLEKAVRQEFFSVLREWLARRFAFPVSKGPGGE